MRASAILKKIISGCVLAGLASVSSIHAADDAARLADSLSGRSGYAESAPRVPATELADRLSPAAGPLQPLPFATPGAGVSQADRVMPRLPPVAQPVRREVRSFGVPSAGFDDTANQIRQRQDGRSLADSLVPPMAALPERQPAARRLSQVPGSLPFPGLPQQEFDSSLQIMDLDALPQPAAVSDYSPGYPESFAEAHAKRVHMIVQDEQSLTLAQKWHMHSVRWTTRNRTVSNKFIEYYDADAIEPDNLDDYGMQIVVASGNAQQPRYGTDSSELLNRKITDIRPSLNYAWGDIPEESLPEDFNDKMDRGDYVAALPPRTVLQWAPTNQWHNPLYFEDPALERYGHTYNCWVQPFASGGRFMTQLVGLPYQMTLHPVHAREYTLGWYRPGECAPKLKYQVPFNEEATIIQTLSVVGLFLIIP